MMDNIEKGANLIFPIFLVLLGVFVWGLCAYEVLVNRLEKTNDSGLPVLGVFLIPFIYGFLWLLGALFG